MMPFQTPRLPARPHVDLDMSSATIAHTAIQDASSTEATVLRGRPEGLRLRNRPPSRAAVPAASRARWAGGQFFSWDVGRGTGTTDDGRRTTMDNSESGILQGRLYFKTGPKAHLESPRTTPNGSQKMSSTIAPAETRDIVGYRKRHEDLSSFSGDDGR